MAPRSYETAPPKDRTVGLCLEGGMLVLVGSFFPRGRGTTKCLHAFRST